jgi:hypothetical protein
MEVNRFIFFIVKGLSILSQLTAAVFYLVFIFDSQYTDKFYLTRVGRNQFFDLCDILDCEKNGTMLKIIINIIAMGVFYIQFLIFSNRSSVFIFRNELPSLSCYVTPVSHISKRSILF